MTHRFRRLAGILLALAAALSISLMASPPASAAPASAEPAAVAGCGTPYLKHLTNPAGQLLGDGSVALCEGTRRHIVVADKLSNGLQFGIVVWATNGNVTPYPAKNVAGGSASQYDITYPYLYYRLCDRLNTSTWLCGQVQTYGAA